MNKLKMLLASVLLLLVATVAYAAAKTIPMPTYLAGATITVTLKDGKQYSFKSEEYAVVPRTQSGDEAAADAPLSKGEYRPNSVKLYLGGGPAGIKSKTDGVTTTVDQAYGVNYGVGYGRKITDEISLDGILLLNRNGAQGGLLGVGYNW
jgi:hypothetical protein